VTVREIAHQLALILRKQEIDPELPGECRVGDIRHCFADVGKAQRLLGFSPSVSLEQGMAELAGWLEGQVADDLIDRARGELRSRGLTA
jgi:dTDP-L-rhamnose 4-epimerase